MTLHMHNIEGVSNVPHIVTFRKHHYICDIIVFLVCTVNRSIIVVLSWEFYIDFAMTWDQRHLLGTQQDF